MSTKSPLEFDPRTIMTNDEGDVMPPVEGVFANGDKSLNREILYMDHPAYGPEATVTDRTVGPETAATGLFRARTVLNEPVPGPSTKLVDRDQNMLATLDAVARTKVAQGMAHNRYNRASIARRADLHVSEVNEYGAVTAPERRQYAAKAFNKLMDYDKLRESGIDTKGMPTLNDFVAEFFSDSDPMRSKRLRDKMRRQIAKRQKAS